MGSNRFHDARTPRPSEAVGRFHAPSVYSLPFTVYRLFLMPMHMTPEEYRENGYAVIDWIADYMEQVET